MPNARRNSAAADSEDGVEESEYVKLRSSDGFDFVVRRSAAKISPAIKAMLDPEKGFKEAESNTCVLDINAVLLGQVCRYLNHAEKYKGHANVPDLEIPLEHTLQLILTCDYLNL
ncbi:POZ domain-containing protein [Piedraia hortae CBS 480.64]|uniref:Elongin-C n=1 Tax=Piedraia hortae CBS 480.64 TaxID=1314780 RepID=A0A6A7BXL1_9PEZI|nr:POZ domain-containing protein [Piedraia hortae CBS 480.64]